MSKQKIKGESTTATVMTDQYDENCGQQIQELADHEAFNNPIVVMPDCHYGSGAVIGFTMPIGERVVPNCVGVDIGCGMTARNLGQPDRLVNESEEEYTRIDSEIRDVIPFGRDVYDYQEQDYHIVNDFPWDECADTLEQFMENHDTFEVGQPATVIDWFDGYGKEYFMNLCKRVGYDQSRTINSLGTLGGGNHFIEISRSETNDDYWVVIHSGSRGIGLNIAQYWQNRATEYTTTRMSITDVPDKYRPYLQDNWKPDAEMIRSDFDGAEIQQMFDAISGVIQEYGPNANNRDTDLDWLEGDEAVGYCIDMIFAQKYASDSRREMVDTVSKLVGSNTEREIIESTHNYIDFNDGIIRKGATKATKGERLIIPFNMRDGTIVCEGKGNSDWNMSAPHGAGRRMSRSRAFSELDINEFQNTMSDVFSTSVTEETLDEAPAAYKDTAVIESVIEETATIIDRWTPVMNLKAEE